MSNSYPATWELVDQGKPSRRALWSAYKVLASINKQEEPKDADHHNRLGSGRDDSVQCVGFKVLG